MHRKICENNKGSAEHTKPNSIRPECKDVEAEGAKDSRTGDFNVQAVLMVDQAQIADLIDNESFEGEVKDRQLLYMSV